jgi:very-short-patch-repair endonuclease
VDVSALRAIAGEQAGLFTRSQATACGYSAYQIRQRLVSGEWQRVVGQALSLAGQPVSARLIDRGLALTLPDAVLAGVSAARLHGIPARAAGSCVITLSKSRLSAPGLRILRESVSRHDVALLGDLLVTGPARTVFDLLRELPFPAATDLLDQALQQRWITLPELAARVRGHAGRRRAPELVRLVRHAADGARSVAERLAVELLRRAGITGFVVNADIHDRAGRLIGVGDLVFPRQRLVVEIDGRAHHVSPAQFQRDRERQNALVTAGWTVLRFTWADLTRRPGRVVQVVRRQLG